MVVLKHLELNIGKMLLTVVSNRLVKALSINLTSVNSLSKLTILKTHSHRRDLSALKLTSSPHLQKCELPVSSIQFRSVDVNDPLHHNL